MALYEYLCPACRKAFELMRPMSDAHRGAACPGCGSEAQRVMLGSPSAENSTEAAAEPSRNDSETRTPTSEAGATNQRIGMIPAFDFERSTGPQGRLTEDSRGQDIAPRPSDGGTAASARTAVKEGIAAYPEVDLQEDTAPLEMPWLTESQPGGGNLWSIRDWGIASIFGYIRERRATESVESLPFPAAEMDAKSGEADAYRQLHTQPGAAVIEPDSAAGPADGAGGHPTFSEWRAAISMMPWLQETGIEPSEDNKEPLAIVIEGSDMPGLRPRRDRGTAQLVWAGWLQSQPAAEHTADAAGRRARPAKEAKEGMAADFPRQVIEAAWRRQGGRCAGCGRWLIWQHRDRESGTGAWESHHRIPVDRGGSSLPANCVLFCSGVADCHFNRGHGGVGWTHYAPLDDSTLLFLFAGSASAASPASTVRPKRNLLREVLGIPQSGKGSRKAGDESGGRDSSG